MEKYSRMSKVRDDRQANRNFAKFIMFTGALAVVCAGAVKLGNSDSKIAYNVKTFSVKLTNQGNKEAENSIKYLKGEIELDGYEADAGNSILYGVPIDQRESVFHDYCEDINATNEEELKAAYPEIFGNEPKTR